MIAALRADWSKLDSPARIQELADRHLTLKRIDPRNTTDSTGCRSGHPTWCRRTPPIRSARCSRTRRSSIFRPQASRRARGRPCKRPTRPSRCRSRREPLREPWHRRLVRTLLYGQGVDRAAKSKARLGLAILLFARRLCGDRRPAGALRRDRQHHRAARLCRRRSGHRPAGHSRPQRRNSRDRRAHGLAVRRAAPHHRRRRGGRTARPR